VSPIARQRVATALTVLACVAALVALEELWTHYLMAEITQGEYLKARWMPLALKTSALIVLTQVARCAIDMARRDERKADA
jgi:hypothetical protein